MKQGYLYTVVFVLVAAFLFTAILATAQTVLHPRIAANQANAEKAAILYVFGIAADDFDLESLFEQYVSTTQVNGLEVYIYADQAGVKNYAVPFTGAGLWGSIHGYLAVSADLTEITGLEFTKQSETPGLGSRIDEAWYKEQFRGIKIADAVPVFADQSGTALVDAVTGATSSSNAVLQIVTETIEKRVSQLEVLLP